ncbi:serine hydrolase [Reyranella sp. CPCC 100927]|uniref:serine hydrolase domain-containing protein n=1 Tax=Reyranella sp. CPCC 100927 TaxID=2599616 RepID=UPI002106287F|nr:serine hydrolase [Reyranella sp. CPCC 100927]
MRRFHRRPFLLSTGALLMTAGPLQAAPFDWTPVTPAAAGFAPDLSARLDAAIAAGKLPNLHGVIVARAGKLVLERYMTGADESWGDPLGTVTFRPTTLHDLRSVTKSIVGLLYGIALSQGKVPAPDQPLLAQFPEYPDLASDPARQKLTIGHVLTMTMGTAWNEDIPYTSPANSEIAMEMAPDRYRFVLERPIVGEPGARWTYSGGATALLGQLIAKGTGRSLPDFARDALFAPLGIGTFEWSRGMDKVTPSAASGLRLAPRDLARIGHMMLQNGVWDGRPVVPPSWLNATLQDRARIDDFRRYGYHWYMGAFPVGPGGARRERWIGAAGNGGQRLYVLPGLDLVVVTTFGNYNKPDQWAPPLALLLETVLPAVT